MLEIKNLQVNYGPINALKEVTMTIEKNKINAIIGVNGAGKSTLLNTISGLVDPDQGEISYKGRQIQNIPVEKRVKLGIGHVMEGRRLFKDQSVHDNLLIGFYFRNPKEKRRNALLKINEIYKQFPILGNKQNQMAGTLSGGQQQILIISAALLSEPDLLLLDEPSLGLAPIIIDEVYQLLEELKSKGMTIIISEQMAALALRISDVGYILERGQVVKKGDRSYLKSLLDSDGLSSVYLGKAKV
ncbi:ABC transporter ATP-binding protein [Jeotgalibacillus soli]|uniref:ABC transporter-like protein n=1 Tax=Jeotgalibacillus soli TaxID=889306 RepID=A0A0C2VLR4_9BACL|nr:ABC transporter ATP-binding protein [Jeotgalibacillus soli]KIL45406.1 ABC transporter-like protein [Jeotgalibacillus soli]